MHPPRRPTDPDPSPTPDTTPAGGVCTPGAGGAPSPGLERVDTYTPRDQAAVHELPGHISAAELVECPRCGCSLLSLDVVHYCDPAKDSGVKLHSRVRVAELRNAVQREIDELRQQKKVPGQPSVITWLEISWEALEAAERLLGQAERELAKEKT